MIKLDTLNNMLEELELEIQRKTPEGEVSVYAIIRPSGRGDVYVQMPAVDTDGPFVIDLASWGKPKQAEKELINTLAYVKRMLK